MQHGKEKNKMLLRFRKTASIVFILLVLLALLIAVQTYQEKTIGGDRDEHGCLVGAGYSWSDAQSACIRVWLNDSSEDYYQKFYCSEESRNFNACAEVYDPVCGSNKQTYSNNCFACIDKNVQYYIQGQCK